MHWPLEAVETIDQVQGGETLRLFLLSPKGQFIKIFRFITSEECKTWYDEMLNVLNKRPLTTPVPIGHPEVDPVLLLQQRPSERFQLLGQLEATSRTWSQARIEVQLSGAVLGADAVVDVHEERITDFRGSNRRISGTAIRAVDQVGRQRLKSRWFADQILSLTKFMFIIMLISIAYMLADFAVAAEYTRLPLGHSNLWPCSGILRGHPRCGVDAVRCALCHDRSVALA